MNNERANNMKVNNEGMTLPELVLAILLLIVGIAIAYDTIFADEIINGASITTSSDLNFFSTFIIDFSNEMPFFYGLFTIMFAIILGVGAACIRRFISNIRKKLAVTSRKKNVKVVVERD